MNYPYVRVHCMDCATRVFVVTTDDVCTRCERCTRKYEQQIYLLRKFLART